MSALRIVHAERPPGLRLRRRIARRLATVLDPRVEKTARRIVAAIRKGGDAALLDAARAHRRHPRRWHDRRSAACAASRGQRLAERRAGPQDAIELAIGNVEHFHRAQLAAAGEGFVVERSGRHARGGRAAAPRVGLYVPGGRASYPSTAH